MGVLLERRLARRSFPSGGAARPGRTGSPPLRPGDVVGAKGRHTNRIRVPRMSFRLCLPAAGVPGRSGHADACVCTALRMLSRYASGELDRVLAPHGLTLTESQLMMTLWEGGAGRTLALARRLRPGPGTDEPFTGTTRGARSGAAAGALAVLRMGARA